MRYFLGMVVVSFLPPYFIFKMAKNKITYRETQHNKNLLDFKGTRKVVLDNYIKNCPDNNKSLDAEQKVLDWWD